MDSVSQRAATELTYNFRAAFVFNVLMITSIGGRLHAVSLISHDAVCLNDHST